MQQSYAPHSRVLVSPFQAKGVSRKPPVSLLPFNDDAQVQLSSRGALWDDTLMAELTVVQPGELKDCCIMQTTVIQPLDSNDVTINRLGKGHDYEVGSIKDVIHLDPRGSLIGVRWPQPLSVFFMMPSDLAFQRVLEDARGPGKRFELVRANYVPDQQIRQIGYAVLAECQSGFPSGRLYGESLAIALAARLAQCYSADPVRLPQSQEGLPMWRLRRVTDFIEDNLDAELSLQDLAAVAGFSEYHFSRMFKTRTGTAPHRYVLERRVARAKKLLADGQMPIKEVSAAVGFADQAHLSTIFKKITGLTPKKFREQML